MYTQLTLRFGLFNISLRIKFSVKQHGKPFTYYKYHQTYLPLRKRPQWNYPWKCKETLLTRQRLLTIFLWYKKAYQTLFLCFTVFELQQVSHLCKQHSVCMQCCKTEHKKMLVAVTNKLHRVVPILIASLRKWNEIRFWRHLLWYDGKNLNVIPD